MLWWLAFGLCTLFALGLFGVRASIVSGRVLCLAGTVLLSLLLTLLIRYDRREGLARKLAEEGARSRLGTV